MLQVWETSSATFEARSDPCLHLVEEVQCDSGRESEMESSRINTQRSRHCPGYIELCKSQWRLWILM